MPTLADDLCHAGAVMVARGDRRVAIHFGSVSGEESVCRKHVGISVRADFDVLELAARADRLELALGRLLTATPPLPGQATRVGRAWCAHADPERALVVGPPPAVAAVRRLVAGSAIPVRCADRSTDTTAIALIGPRVRALLASAGLPADLAPETVRVRWWAGHPVVLLCERPDRLLLLVRAEHATAAWHDLVDAGRPLELSCVGLDALERLAAASV